MLRPNTVIRILGVVLVVALVLSAGSMPSQAQSRKRVALIIAQGGLGDHSYNDLAFAGLTKAAQDFDAEVKPIESPDPVGQVSNC